MMKQVRPETGIVHLRVPNATDLRAFLLGADLDPLPLKVTGDLITEWLHYGSVYVDGRRARENCGLTADQIVRLHTRRKTYVARIPELNGRIVLDHPDFLVLDKPSGLPTHATLDNYIENAAYLLAQELGQPVYVTHRLDVATSGLLILAKSPKAQAAINKQFAKRQVEKIYAARAARDVAPGLYVHYMDPQSRVPKVMSSGPREGWWECRMKVLASEKGLLTINLLTGKTHQIRAQLKELGAPIDGDAVYGSTRPALSGQIDLQCSELRFRWMQREYAIKKPAHE